jgi:hypothetical protein
MNVEDTILTPGPSLDSTISDEDIANIFSDPTKPQPKEDGSSTDSGHSTDISGDSKNDSTEQTGEIEAEKGEEEGEESARSVEFVTAPIISSIFEQLGLDFDEEELSAAIVKHGDDMAGISRILKDVVDATIEANSAPEYASEITEQFDNFVRNGGDAKTFFDAIYSSVDYNKLDTSDINSQIFILREFYRATTSLSNERIDKTIKALHTAGELESVAKDAKVDLIKFKDQERLEVVKRQEQEAYRRQQEYVEGINKQKNVILSGSKSELGFIIPDADKKGLVKFLYEVDPVTQETQYQARMKSVPNFGLRLAYLAYKNVLNEEGLMKVSTTRSTQKLQSTVQESMDKLRSKPKNNTSPSQNTGAKKDKAYLEQATNDLAKHFGIS